MDALMLEGWTPILLCGIIFAIGMYITSRKISRNSLFATTSVLSLICIGVIIYSVIGVGGWDCVGLVFLTITIFVGVWVGTFIGVVSRW